MKRETLSLALSCLDDRHITDTAVFSPRTIPSAPERIIHMNKKRIITFALVAALVLAFGITAYAVWGVPRSVGTHPMPKAAEYTSLAELSKIERDVGYPVTMLESFSNGYAFDGLRVDGEAVFGEANEALKEYYTVRAVYSKEGAPELQLVLSPHLEYEGKSDAPAPCEQRTVKGVTVDLSLDHYKVVPEDYEKTEADLAREAAGHYYISFGSDTIEEREMAFAVFTLHGADYTLMDMTANAGSVDTLFQMAGELIEAAGA